MGVGAHDAADHRTHRRQRRTDSVGGSEQRRGRAAGGGGVSNENGAEKLDNSPAVVDAAALEDGRVAVEGVVFNKALAALEVNTGPILAGAVAFVEVVVGGQGGVGYEYRATISAGDIVQEARLIHQDIGVGIEVDSAAVRPPVVKEDDLIEGGPGRGLPAYVVG